MYHRRLIRDGTESLSAFDLGDPRTWISFQRATPLYEDNQAEGTPSIIGPAASLQYRLNLGQGAEQGEAHLGGEP